MKYINRASRIHKHPVCEAVEDRQHGFGAGAMAHTNFLQVKLT